MTIHVIGTRPCGFCGTGTCELCPESIANAAGAAGSTWSCPCAEAGHAAAISPAAGAGAAGARRRPASARRQA
jgi:hypothetical protein